MSKRLVVLVLITLCIVSFVSKQQDHKSVNTFKIESVGVKM